MWNSAGSTIRWIEKKWEELKRLAVRELQSIGREALCPVCEEWKLKEKNPVESLISLLREDHDLNVTGARAEYGDIGVWFPGGTVSPVYRRL